LVTLLKSLNNYNWAEANFAAASSRAADTASIDAVWAAVQNPADGAIAQDIEDCFDYDHWRDTPDAQAPHFMRASGQKPVYAFEEASKWIRKKIGDFVGAVGNVGSSREWTPYKGLLTRGKPSEHLGRALHTVQDSFSPAHVERDNGVGVIRDIKSYKLQLESAEDHGGPDRAWLSSSMVRETTGGAVLVATPVGQRAVDASADLIVTALKLAVAKQAPDVVETSLWKRFVQKHFSFLSLS
jgi:hypothetical protein